MSRTAYCSIQGGQLYYETCGEGHPLVLIHAGIAHSAMWDAQMDAFSKHYQVIRYDLRGHGKSSSEATRFSNHQDLHDLMEHLDIKQAHLCGISMGGKIALEYALSHPDKVTALVMTATGLINDPNQSEQEKQLFEQMDALEEAGEWHDVSEVDVRLFIDGPNSPEGRADPVVRQKVQQMALSNYLAYYERHSTEETEPQAMALTPAAAVRLEELNTPTLTMVGDLDISRAIKSSEFIAEKVKGAKRIIILDTAHLPSMEKPDMFNKYVLEFLVANP